MNIRIYNEKNINNIYLAQTCTIYENSRNIIIYNTFLNTSIKIAGPKIALDNLKMGLSYGMEYEVFINVLRLICKNYKELEQELWEGHYVE